MNIVEIGVADIFQIFYVPILLMLHLLFLARTNVHSFKTESIAMLSMYVYFMLQRGMKINCCVTRKNIGQKVFRKISI